MKFDLKWLVVYFSGYIAVSWVIVPVLFGIIVAPQISPSLSSSAVNSILDDAIVVNGIILGFILVVLDTNMKEIRGFGPKSRTHPDFYVRYLVLIIDVAMITISILDLYGEMFGLAGISTSATSQLQKALFQPFRFGLYVGFRFGALALG